LTPRPTADYSRGMTKTAANVQAGDLVEHPFVERRWLFVEDASGYNTRTGRPALKMGSETVPMIRLTLHASRVVKSIDMAGDQQVTVR
jgi:hypothetical protein